jgi:hypothetical protein
MNRRWEPNELDDFSRFNHAEKIRYQLREAEANYNREYQND